MRIAVGCPTFERSWCLPLWFDSLDAQDLYSIADEVCLCFAYSKSLDGTYDILENRGSKYDELRIYQYDLQTYSDRDLNRLPILAQLRNALLEIVRETDADYFLSWDDDILFNRRDILQLWNKAAPDTAVGALIDMGGNDAVMAHPSIMHFPNAPGEIAFRRPFNEYDWTEPFEAEVIMAVKLMGKEVYQNTQYSWDPVGEDIAWSMDAAKKDYKRYIYPSVRGIHLYDKAISLQVQQRFPALSYPEILGPLSRWYEDPATWKEDPWP